MVVMQLRFMAGPNHADRLDFDDHVVFDENVELVECGGSADRDGDRPIVVIRIHGLRGRVLATEARVNPLPIIEYATAFGGQ
jgi:hypothetical protein